MKTRSFAYLIIALALMLCFAGCESTEEHTHTEVIDAAISPTCTATGKTEGKHCSECGEILTAQKDIAELGHTEVVDADIAPTCTAVGKTEGKYCAECGEGSFRMLTIKGYDSYQN